MRFAAVFDDPQNVLLHIVHDGTGPHTGIHVKFR